MAKFLIRFSYSGKGLEGLMKEGGSARREAARQLAKTVGGNLEAFYFAFGEQDGFAIIEVSDNISMTALAMALNQSGAVTTQTIALISPEEVDEALKLKVSFRPPGQ